MTPADLLSEGFGQLPALVHAAVEGLGESQLAERPGRDANSVAWLVWHLARVQDDHVCNVAGTEQVWTAAGWADRFGLPFDDDAIGYGFSSEQVGQVKAAPGLLTGYYDAVHEQTTHYLRSLSAEDLDRVVDQSWDPPVTLGVRLLSVLGDDLQHVGQAAYVRGLLT
jgi:uncharacterized damage-inducible protein DinB